jgi:ketosteroid isomerase-like protein
MNHRMMILFTAGLLFAVSSCQQQQKTAAFSDADRAAVKAVFDSTVARVSRKDFASWANEYTEDGVLMPPNHPTVKGRSDIKAWGDSLPPITSFAFNDVTAEGDGDVAYGTSSYALTFSPPGAAATNDRGKQLVTLHRQSDGSWLVTAASFNSDIPLPAPPPPANAKK